MTKNDNNNQVMTTDEALGRISECFSVLEKVDQLELLPDAHENFREIAYRLAFAKKVILSDEYPDSYRDQAFTDIIVTKRCCDKLKGIV